MPTRGGSIRGTDCGAVFGGRYKSIVVEPDNCFWALLDYLHLNPVRAGLVREADGLEASGQGRGGLFARGGQAGTGASLHAAERMAFRVAGVSGETLETGGGKDRGSEKSGWIPRGAGERSWGAECLLKAGRKHFALEAEELRPVRKNDWRKAVMAELIQAETTVRLDWIADRLAMGTRSGCCRLIRKTREGLRKKPGWRKARTVIQ